jgi:hypothetical protein
MALTTHMFCLLKGWVAYAAYGFRWMFRHRHQMIALPAVRHGGLLAVFINIISMVSCMSIVEAIIEIVRALYSEKHFLSL